tara:strand:+ start:697 stop:948 length:252 start_codon:yes stop_codon:yes gene_type:complete
MDYEITNDGKIMGLNLEEPLTIKELSYFSGRGRTYLHAMKKNGLKMTIKNGVNLTTFQEFLDFERDYPDFQVRDAYKYATEND